MELEITLALSIVNQENDEYYSYPYDHIKSKAAKIIIDSLWGFEALGMKIDKYKNVVVLARTSKDLNGANVFFGSDRKPMLVTYDPKMPLNLKKKFIRKYLEYNYGDGGPDGWMEGNIYIDPQYELWLGLNKVEIYKNGQLYMLFDDPNYLEKIGDTLDFI